MCSVTDKKRLKRPLFIPKFPGLVRSWSCVNTTRGSASILGETDSSRLFGPSDASKLLIKERRGAARRATSCPRPCFFSVFSFAGLCLDLKPSARFLSVSSWSSAFVSWAEKVCPCLESEGKKSTRFGSHRWTDHVYSSVPTF